MREVKATQHLPGTPEQIDKAAQEWFRSEYNREPSDWYIAGWYCRMRGWDCKEDKLNDPDPACVAWVEGWRDAHGTLAYT